MNSDSLEPLLERLCQGDMSGARRLFLAYEPYLRRFVRRLLSKRLRIKFDSTDIVQSVWADVLRGHRAGGWHFPDLQSFQAFLVRVARNRFLATVRRHRHDFARQKTLAGLHTSEQPLSPQPQAPAVLEAQELWEQIQALCPPEHQELLHLKRQGVAIEELAARTGLHPGSIRRIFRNLASKLTLQERPVAFDGSLGEV
jgi:RNA polymerase sigma-70 factor (ECF subfamily)